MTEIPQNNPPLKKMHPKVGEWMGAMVQGLWERGYFEESEAMLYELAELNEADLPVVRQYLSHNQPDLATTFENILARVHGRRIPGTTDESNDASTDKADGSE